MSAYEKMLEDSYTLCSACERSRERLLEKQHAKLGLTPKSHFHVPFTTRSQAGSQSVFSAPAQPRLSAGTSVAGTSRARTVLPTDRYLRSARGSSPEPMQTDPSPSDESNRLLDGFTNLRDRFFKAPVKSLNPRTAGFGRFSGAGPHIHHPNVHDVSSPAQGAFLRDFGSYYSAFDPPSVSQRSVFDGPRGAKSVFGGRLPSSGTSAPRAKSMFGGDMRGGVSPFTSSGPAPVFESLQSNPLARGHVRSLVSGSAYFSTANGTSPTSCRSRKVSFLLFYGTIFRSVSRIALRLNWAYVPTTVVTAMVNFSL